MDLKGTTSLDPKLKEAYEKVMGTSFTPAASPPNPQAPAAAATSNPNPSPAQPAVSVPNIQAPLQPPPVQPLHITEVAQEEPQPAQPLMTTPLQAPNNPNLGPEMVPSPQIFSEVNPFKEPAPVPGEVLANNGVANEKKSNKLVTVGVVIGGIVFFVIYAFIWAKVFGLF